MSTSKFQGVILVYCMEQIRDALIIRSLLYTYHKFCISVSDQYQFGIYQITSRSDIIASLIVLDALHNKNHVYIYNNNKYSCHMLSCIKC